MVRLLGSRYVRVLFALLVLGLSAGGVTVLAGEAELSRAETELDGSPRAGDVELGEIVVTAKRKEEASFESDRSVAVVGAIKLAEQTPRTAPEALMEAPGVFVQKTNHGGGSPIIRGMVGPQNLILIDGIRLNNSVHRTGPTQYLNMIDPYSVERFEVLRGPGSVLYGSDALGGVMHAITKSPAERGQEDGIGYNGEFTGRHASADRGRTGHGLIDLGRGPLRTRRMSVSRKVERRAGPRGTFAWDCSRESTCRSLSPLRTSSTRSTSITAPVSTARGGARYSLRR